MDATFLTKMLSYIQASGGVSPVSAKVYYANTSGQWYNSSSRIGGYTAKTTGFTATSGTGLDTAASDTLIDWGSQLGSSWATPTSPLGSNGSSGSVYAGGLYVLGGSNGSLATSSDGTTWTTRTSAMSGNHVSGIFYGGSTYVVVGYNGAMCTSTDAITWTARTSSFGTTRIRRGTYGASTFVATGDSGKIATSSDAITWTQQTTPFGASGVIDVAYGASLFVAVGEGGKLATSPDGVTWTSRTSSFGTTPLTGVDFGASKFVAVGNTGKIATSPDGVTWTQQTSPTTVNLVFVKYLAGVWVCGGDSGVVMTSPDGVTWTNWQTNTPWFATGPTQLATCASNGTDLVASGGTITSVSQPGAFISTTTVAGVIVDVLGTGANGSLLPASDASTPTYTAGTAPPAISVGNITLSYGGSSAYLGEYVGDFMLYSVDNGVGTTTGYLATAATCRLLSSYTSPTAFTEITTAQYSSYSRQTCGVSVSGTTLSNSTGLFFTIYGSSPTAPTITHAAIFDNLDRIIMCVPLPTPIARTDYIRDITIAANSMQLSLNPTQSSTPA